VHELAVNLTPAAVDDRYFKVLIVSQAVIAEILRHLFAVSNRVRVCLELDADPISHRNAISHIEEKLLHNQSSITCVASQVLLLNSVRSDSSI
jgi:hypothetical protein